MAATVVNPASAPSLGADRVMAVVTVASMTAPKIATEVDAATSVDISCALMSDGWNPNTTQSKTTRKRRLCSKVDTETLQPALCTIDTIMYTTGDPQSPDTNISTMFVEGALVYLVERLGPDSGAAYAVGQKVITHYVRLGKPYRVRDLGADNGEFAMAVNVVYVNSTGPVEGVLAA